MQAFLFSSRTDAFLVAVSGERERRDERKRDRVTISSWEIGRDSFSVKCASFPSRHFVPLIAELVLLFSPSAYAARQTINPKSKYSLDSFSCHHKKISLCAYADVGRACMKECQSDYYSGLVSTQA